MLAPNESEKLVAFAKESLEALSSCFFDSFRICEMPREAKRQNRSLTEEENAEYWDMVQRMTGTDFSRAAINSGADAKAFADQAAQAMAAKQNAIIDQTAQAFGDLAQVAVNYGLNPAPFTATLRVLSQLSAGIIRNDTRKLDSAAFVDAARVWDAHLRGADHPVDALLKLENAIRTWAPAAARADAPQAQTPPAIDYVTMDQAAALVNRSKKSFERYLAKGKFPPPDVEGGGGKPHEWDYAKLRPFLEKQFGKNLPSRPPHVVKHG